MSSSAGQDVRLDRNRYGRFRPQRSGRSVSQASASGWSTSADSIPRTERSIPSAPPPPDDGQQRVRRRPGGRPARDRARRRPRPSPPASCSTRLRPSRRSARSGRPRGRARAASPTRRRCGPGACAPSRARAARTGRSRCASTRIGSGAAPRPARASGATMPSRADGEPAGEAAALGRSSWKRTTPGAGRRRRPRARAASSGRRRAEPALALATTASASRASPFCEADTAGAASRSRSCRRRWCARRRTRPGRCRVSAERARLLGEQRLVHLPEARRSARSVGEQRVERLDPRRDRDPQRAARLGRGAGRGRGGRSRPRIRSRRSRAARRGPPAPSRARGPASAQILSRTIVLSDEEDGKEDRPAIEVALDEGAATERAAAAADAEGAREARVLARMEQDRAGP